MMTRSSNKSFTDLEVLLSDFRGYLNDASASASFAAMGLQHLANYFGNIPSSPMNPDPTVHLGIGDPNLPTAVAYAALPVQAFRSCRDSPQTVSSRAR